MLKITVEKKNLFIAAVLATAVFSSCSEKEYIEQTSAVPTKTNTFAVSQIKEYDTETVNEESPVSEKSEDSVRSPMEAAENYLNDMCGKDGIVSVSITGVKVPQISDGIAAARYGRSNDPNEYITLVLADYTLEYSENSGEESVEKSEWIAIKASAERGFYFYESFPSEPHSFIGTVTEISDDYTFTVVPDEGSPELEIAESFTLQVYPVPDTPPENVGDRVRVTYNGSITIDENGLPHIEKIIVYTDDLL